MGFPLGEEFAPFHGLTEEKKGKKSRAGGLPALVVRLKDEKILQMSLCEEKMTMKW
jgi:hypothetical protein